MSVSGFIYVLENESMPGIVKIGMTTRLPEARAAELWTTGVPTPFAIAFAMHVSDVHESEAEVHEELSDYRLNSSREFFRIDKDLAIRKILPLVVNASIACIEAEMCVDEADVCLIAHKCGVHPFSFPRLVNFVSNEAWNAAAARYQEWLDVKSRERAEGEVQHGT